MYPEAVEEAVARLEPVVREKAEGKLNSRWLSLKLLDADESLIREIDALPREEFLKDEELVNELAAAKEKLLEQEIDGDRFKDMIVSALVKSAEEVCAEAVAFENHEYAASDRKLDKIPHKQADRISGDDSLLAMVFWLTITGRQLPITASGRRPVLGSGQTDGTVRLSECARLAPRNTDPGVYRVLAWVVSVMLPPMAIFFPLFTLLEDAGYLPRVAYNLDKSFKRCCACGKQALCMCMGFGCNAAGVIGCRIIDSPRERLLAILTNNFVPCNGGFRR